MRLWREKLYAYDSPPGEAIPVREYQEAVKAHNADYELIQEVAPITIINNSILLEGTLSAKRGWLVTTAGGDVNCCVKMDCIHKIEVLSGHGI